MSPDYDIGDLQVRPAQRSVLRQGRPLGLGARAFDLLLALLQHRDRVVAKDELLALVWPGVVVEEGNLAVHVSALRKLLGARAIATVPGRGYRFTAPVVERVPMTEPTAAAAEPATEADLAPSERAWTELMDKLRAPVPDGDGRDGHPPPALTPLLGRDAALQALRALWPATRCLTLTGAGGSGKTRLAQALVDSLCREPGAADAVVWLGLESLTDAAQLAPTLARAVGAAAAGGDPLRALLVRLQGRPAWLVLDNCEHLVDGVAALVAQLLRALPQLRLLCTSRESLRVAGERVWPVPPLDVPDAAADGPPERLLQHASVQLLVQQIRQGAPDFAVTPENAAPLAALCRGLAGLPLALELVAAQVGPLSLAQVAARLDRSLVLLRVGARDGPRHHQTMAAAVDWGYRLLAAPDPAVFRRLAVFVGGGTLEAVAAACQGIDWARGEGTAAGDPAAPRVDAQALADELPESLGRLLRASMLVAVEVAGRVRFRLLEPIRQFAWAQLEAAGELEATRRQLLAWFVVQGPQLAARLHGPQQASAYAALNAEFDTLRALLAWSLEADLAAGVRLACDLWRFWQVQGHAEELRAWFDAALARAEGLPAALRADAHNSAGVMARTGGHCEAARAQHRAALALQRELGQRRGEATALNNLCVVARDQHAFDEVLQLAAECLDLARELGDRGLEGLALMHRGAALRGLSRASEAAEALQASHALFSALGERRSVATLHNFLGRLALERAQPDGLAEAAAHFAQARALNEELHDAWGLGITRCNQGWLSHAQREPAAALAHVLEGLEQFRRAGARHGVDECFELLAWLWLGRGEPARAAWCCGVVAQLEATLGRRPGPLFERRRAPLHQALQAALPAPDLDRAWAEGQAQPLGAAFERARGWAAPL